MKQTNKAKLAAVATTATARAPISPRDALLHKLFGDYSAARFQIEKFTASMSESLTGRRAAHTLEWASNAIAAAATAKVLEGVLYEVWSRECSDEPVTVDQIRKTAVDCMTRGAMYPSRSTSQISNLLSQEETAAWGQLASTLARWD